MAAVRRQQTRRPSQPFFELTRPLGNAIIAAFCRGFAPATERAAVLTSRRGPSSVQQLSLNSRVINSREDHEISPPAHANPAWALRPVEVGVRPQKGSRDKSLLLSLKRPPTEQQVGLLDIIITGN